MSPTRRDLLKASAGAVAAALAGLPQAAQVAAIPETVSEPAVTFEMLACIADAGTLHHRSIDIRIEPAGTTVQIEMLGGLIDGHTIVSTDPAVADHYRRMVSVFREQDAEYRALPETIAREEARREQRRAA